MSHFLFRTQEDRSFPGRKLTPERWLRHEFLTQKLNTPLGYLLLCMLAYPIALAVGHGGMDTGIYLLGAAVIIPCTIASLFRPSFGIYLVMVQTFLIAGMSRYVHDIPLSLFLGVTLFFTLVGWVLEEVSSRNWRYAAHPVTLAIGIWIVYNLLIGWFSAGNSLDWGFTFTSMAGMMGVYFVGLYLFSKQKHLKGLGATALGLVLLGSLYAFWQYIFGFNPAELAWINENVNNYQEVYAAGGVRFFSFFADPATLGIICAIALVGALVLVLQDYRRRRWYWVFGAIALLLLPGFLLSGIRTGYVLLPAGLTFYALLAIRRRVFLVLGLFILAGLAILLVPTSNYYVQRFQSAFRPASSISYQERESKWEAVQPYILSHPFGAGHGSTGDWGRRFDAQKSVSVFIPDSGYVRVGVETGWVGLVLQMLMLVVILFTGVEQVFRVRGRRMRIIVKLALTGIFLLIISNYTQEVITRLPFNLLLALGAAVLVTPDALEKAREARQKAKIQGIKSEESP